MNNQIVFRWPSFSVTFDRSTGEVTTHYDVWRYSRVRPDATDEELSKRLSISPKLHKLAHELSHHLIALACGHKTSPIIHRSAHFNSHPQAEAQNEERAVTDLVFAAFGKDKKDRGTAPLNAIQSIGVDVESLIEELRFLVYAGKADYIRTAPIIEL